LAHSLLPPSDTPQ